MIEIKDGTKIFNKGKQNEIVALNNINLTFPDTGLVVICGKSGCGKTTLLNVLGGVDSLSSGEILSSYVGNYSQIIFQDSQLFDDFTTLYNLEIINRINNSNYNIEELLSKYDLEKVKDIKANELSGGQKQRVAILRGIISNKPVLLCDEPTGSLDSKNSLDILNMLKEESKNRLVIIVTHDEELFVPYADKLILMSDGEIISSKDNRINKDRIDYAPSNPKIKNKDVFRFSLKNIIKYKIRYSLVIITLLLSLTLSIIALNMRLMNEYSARSKVYKANNVSAVILANGDYLTPKSITSSKLEEIKKIDANPILVSDNTYLTNDVCFKTINKTKNIKNGEIIITDAEALEIFEDEIDAKNCIGKEYVLSRNKKLIIKDIIDTNFDTNYHETYKNLYETRIITYEDYIESFFAIEYYQLYGTARKDSGSILSPDWNTITYNTSVEDGCIVLNSNYASLISDDPTSLIGKTIEIKLIDENYYLTNTGLTNPDFFKTYKYTVQAIDNNIAKYSSNYALSQNDMLEIIEKHYFYAEGGLIYYAIHNPSSEDLKRIRNIDLCEISYLESSIVKSIKYLDTLVMYEMIIGIILMIVSLFIVVNYILQSVSNSKKSIGVLASLGIKLKSIIKIFIFEILFIVLIGIILSPIITFIFIKCQNKIMILKKVTTISYVYFEPITVVYIVGLISIFIILMFMLLAYSLKRKKIIDIIYNR